MEILVRVDEGSAYSDILLAEAFEDTSLSAQDRRLVMAIVYGVLRYRNQLDWWIEQVASRPVAAMASATRAILRSGVYQLLFMDRIPQPAAVHEAVNLAYHYGHRGVAGFVNAVLRNLQRASSAIRLPDEKANPVRSISLAFAHPEWMVRRWIDRLGADECKKLCRANNQQAALSIRLNTLAMPVDRALADLSQQLEGLVPSGLMPEGFSLDGPRPLTGLEAYRKGFFEIQGLVSMLVARVVNPQPGERVLDACAGRGGKTTHLAQLMANQGTVFALDPFFWKLRRLQENSLRLRAGIIREICADARISPLRNGFDRILLDAPCSSLGIIRKHPEIKWMRAESDLTELAALQSGILEQSSALVSPHGILVYSTCSLEPEETDWVVDRFLKQNQTFVRDDIRPFVPESLHGAVGQDGYLRTYPHRQGLDGFFIARLKRRSPGSSLQEPKGAQRETAADVN